MKDDWKKLDVLNLLEFEAGGIGLVYRLLRVFTSRRRRSAARSKIRSSGKLSLNVEETLKSTEFVPQAIVRREVADIASQLKFKVSRGVDDFDAYEGISLRLGGIPVAVLHYQGHPEGTSTVYLPRQFEDVETITKFLRLALMVLRIKPEQLIWQRKDDPDL